MYYTTGCYFSNNQKKAFVKKKKNIVNIEDLASEMFKVKVTLASAIVKYIFVELNEHHCNLGNQIESRWPLIRTVYHGNESMYLLFRSKSLGYYSQKIKELSSVDSFKKPVRK